MKRFTFRYQTLLEVRERAQREEEERLQYLLGQQRESAADLAKLHADEQAQRDAWLEMQADGTLRLDDMAMIHQFMSVLERRIRVQQRAHEDGVARSDNQREILTEAMRQAEIIRKLKERDLKAWREGRVEGYRALDHAVTEFGFYDDRGTITVADYRY